MLLRLILLTLLTAAAPAAAAKLDVVGTQFVLSLDDGRRLTETQLVGAVLDMTDPQGNPATIRIDAVSPSAERPAVLLMALSARAPDGSFSPVCEPDAQGRSLGLPIAGSFDDKGQYSKTPGKWFLTCTVGSQGKCILWGYDPWTPGPGGIDLSRHYQACQHMVRGDYDGRGVAHTRNGTSIDMWDDLKVQKRDSGADAAYSFEAGWGPDGALCVARTRWADLLPLEVLLASAPRLGGKCDEAEAPRRGALIFNASLSAPKQAAPHASAGDPQ